MIGYSPFICQYYFNESEPNLLFMDYYSVSLDKYLIYNKKLISLNTKLNFIL